MIIVGFSINSKQIARIYSSTNFKADREDEQWDKLFLMKKKHEKIYKHILPEKIMKRGAAWISVLGVLLMTNFASAQFYGDFSIGNLFDSVDASTWVLGALFLIFLFFSNFAISRFTKGQGGAGGSMAAIAFSLLATYGVHRTGWDYDSFFYEIFGFIGISEEILYYIIPLIVLAGLIFSVIKFSLGPTLTVLGLFLLGVSFTDLIYEKGFTLVIGLILFVGGLFLWIRKKKPNLGSSGYSSGSRGYSQRYSDWKAQRQAQQHRPEFFRRSVGATGRVLGTGKFQGVDDWAYRKRQEHDRREQERRVITEQKRNEKLRKQQTDYEYEQKQKALREQKQGEESAKRQEEEQRRQQQKQIDEQKRREENARRVEEQKIKNEEIKRQKETQKAEKKKQDAIRKEQEIVKKREKAVKKIRNEEKSLLDEESRTLNKIKELETRYNNLSIHSAGSSEMDKIKREINHLKYSKLDDIKRKLDKLR